MKVEKIESYPPLTIDEQETVLTWDASMKRCLTSPSLSRRATETGRWL